MLLLNFFKFYIYFIILFNSYNKNNLIIMPQLVPFYFINQITFTFIVLSFLIYIFTKNILPRFVRLFITRLYITKI